MMILRVFMLLGFLAQTSKGCSQTAYYSISQVFVNTCSEVMNNFKGTFLSAFPNFGVNEVVRVSESTVTFITAEFTSQDIISIDGEGLITVESVSCSNAVFKVNVCLKVKLVHENGHFSWKSVSGSFSLITELVSEITFIGDSSSESFEDSVKTAFEHYVKTVVSALYEGGVHSVISFINYQYAQFTKSFTYAGCKCHYEVTEYDFNYNSVMAYLVMHCDGVGDLNQGKPLQVRKVKVGDIAVIYADPYLFSSIIAFVKVNFKKTLTAAECQKQGIFPDVNENLEIEIIPTSFPECKLKPGEATVTFSLQGSIRVGSNKLIVVTIVAETNMFVSITNSIVSLTLGKKIRTEVTCDEGSDVAEIIKNLFENYSAQMVNDIGCAIETFIAPNPLAVQTGDFQCKFYKDEVGCLQTLE